MDNERLKKQMDFILEMDKMKSIMRQTYLANGERKENDAEHSWHLALMCGILAEYSNEPIDVLKTMKMVLLHDAIEIDAGDTYAYDAAGNQTKKEREQKAADRIFPILPEDMAKEYRNLWEEFEESRTPEAKFAHGKTKYLFRKVARKYIPEDTAARKKLGFPVPVRVWLRDDDWYGRVKKMFQSPISRQYFHTEKLTALLEEHHAGKKDNSRKIWTVLAFLFWYQEYFDE